jgi:hypothetical protein
MAYLLPTFTNSMKNISSQMRSPGVRFQRSAASKTMPPAVTLSQLAEQAAQQAVLDQPTIEANQLAQERHDFLNNPIGKFQGNPMTGLDLLKRIADATRNEGERNWAGFIAANIFTVVSLGLMPLIDKDVRTGLRNGLKKGLSFSEFYLLLSDLIAPDGVSLSRRGTETKLVYFGLMLPRSYYFDRVVLTPLARKHLAHAQKVEARHARAASIGGGLLF